MPPQAAPPPTERPAGKEKRGVEEGRSRKRARRSASRATGHAAEPGQGSRGTQKPCPTAWQFLAHLISNEEAVPSSRTSPRVGCLDGSKEESEEGSSEESLAMEWNVIASRAAKIRPLGPSVADNEQARCSKASGKGGAAEGAPLAVSGKALRHKATSGSSNAAPENPCMW